MVNVWEIVIQFKIYHNKPMLRQLNFNNLANSIFPSKDSTALLIDKRLQRSQKQKVHLSNKQKTLGVFLSIFIQLLTAKTFVWNVYPAINHCLKAHFNGLNYYMRCRYLEPR